MVRLTYDLKTSYYNIIINNIQTIIIIILKCIANFKSF